VLIGLAEAARRGLNPVAGKDISAAIGVGLLVAVVAAWGHFVGGWW
jgi:hypothetical protein